MRFLHVRYDFLDRRNCLWHLATFVDCWRICFVPAGRIDKHWLGNRVGQSDREGRPGMKPSEPILIDITQPEELGDSLVRCVVEAVLFVALVVEVWVIAVGLFGA